MMVDVVQHGSTSLLDGLLFMRSRQLKAFDCRIADYSCAGAVKTTPEGEGFVGMGLVRGLMGATF